jgi:hypothetical protein
MVLRLGVAGLDLLDSTLSWTPALRPTAPTVEASAFVAPERFAMHGGSPHYQGNRHPWNIRVGIVAAEVLEWLRAEEALQPGTPAFMALGVDFGAARKDAKSEEGRKFIMAGALGKCGTSSMCALSLAKPLPLERVQAWRAAFLAVNAGAFAALDSAATSAVLRLSSDDRGRNGEHFATLPLSEWFCSCGELVFVEPGCEATGFWAEPEHQDGGASVMHLGLTLYGRRDLACRQGHGLPDVIVQNVPGTVYVGQLTGPRHQVTHRPASGHDLLWVPGLGRCGVNVMMRTALFAFDRARFRNTTPSPQALFEVLTRCFREAFLAEFRLPTLPECLAHVPPP